MYRTVLVTSFVVFRFVSAHGQDGKRMRFSFVLSPQTSWLKSDHSAVSTNGNLFGYNFGLVMDRFFDDNYAFSTGLTINTTDFEKIKYG